jgi:hypothetical protein
MAPSFIVVGAQRCGTTSLYRALMRHPNVLPPNLHKGVNYFDVNYQQGWNWYLGHFPRRSQSDAIKSRTGHEAITFESSGYYMHHPWAPQRACADLPDVKIVVMVRDPVERAYSAYKHEFARGFETENLDRALDLEDDRVEPELARMLADESYQSQVYRHQAYRRRGLYAEQIRAFIERLGRESVHIVDSHDFFTTPEREFSGLVDFLDLPAFTPSTFDRYNARPSGGMPEAARDRLRAEFAEPDAQLAALLGGPPSWMR